MRRIKNSIKLIAFQTFAFLLLSTAMGAAELPASTGLTNIFARPSPH
jgi:hypothetical protein